MKADYVTRGAGSHHTLSPQPCPQAERSRRGFAPAVRCLGVLLLSLAGLSPVLSGSSAQTLRGSLAASAPSTNGATVYLPFVSRPLPPPSWHQGTNTGGLTVYSLAPCPSDCQIVYAGTRDRGVFKSSDGGRTWSAQPVGLEGTTVHWVLVPGQDCGLVYAATWGSGVQKTTDGGAIWIPANTGLADLLLYVLAADPGNQEVLYAGTAKSGVYSSNSGGGIWALASNGLPGAALVNVLVAQAGTPLTLYAGVWSHGVYSSPDGGATWAPARVGLVSTEVYALAFDPSQPGRLYAATKQQGVFRTENQAASWEQDGLLGETAYTVTVGGSGIAYAGTDGTTSGHGVYVRSGAGTWQPLAVQPGSVVIRNLAVSGETLLAGTGDGVWRYGQP
jgi:hypothetical protein